MASFLRNRRQVRTSPAPSSPAKPLINQDQATIVHSSSSSSAEDKAAVGVVVGGEEEEEQKLTLSTLPTEIHLAISKLLIYPDALSLKHSSRHFYNIVDTSIDLKVEWLMERRSLHLECPNDRRCDLGSDLRFCRGSVPLLMRRRREHIECESRPGLGCLVFGTKSCSHRRQKPSTWRKWSKVKLTIELWWIVLVCVPLLCCWFWTLDVLKMVRSS